MKRLISFTTPFLSLAFIFFITGCADDDLGELYLNPIPYIKNISFITEHQNEYEHVWWIKGKNVSKELLKKFQYLGKLKKIEYGYNFITDQQKRTGISAAWGEGSARKKGWKPKIGMQVYSYRIKKEGGLFSSLHYEETILFLDVKTKEVLGVVYFSWYQALD